MSSKRTGIEIRIKIPIGKKVVLIKGVELVPSITFKNLADVYSYFIALKVLWLCTERTSRTIQESTFIAVENQICCYYLVRSWYQYR